MIRIIRGNALDLPVDDNTVDLVATSPPYFGLRSYKDNGEHYEGQIGSEATPAEFVDALIAATREMVRVLKPSGSIWVNLGDKYAGGGGYSPDAPSNIGNNRNGDGQGGARSASNGGKSWGFAPKSLIGIPWRYAIRCIDDLGLILRAEVIWSKPNGLPESVTDRVRRSHEQWFHFTVNPRYYSAVDEIREPHRSEPGREGANCLGGQKSLRPTGPNSGAYNALGALPGSVWNVSTQPLRIPERISHARCCGGRMRPGCKDGIDHFAAFPMEWPRRIITGWSPREVCTVCGEGRRPVVASVGLDMSRPQARRAHELAEKAGLTEDHLSALLSVGVSDTGRGKATQSGTGKNRPEVYALADHARAALGGYAREYLSRHPTGLTYACACPDTTAPTTPGLVLDPFGGTGTTALVADVLGRDAIHVDLSADYCRLAEWRTTDPGERARAMQVEKPAAVIDGQMDLLEGMSA